MSTATYTKTGAKSTSKATLPKDVFAVEVKSHDLLKQVYVSLLSNQRKNNARALERGEVRGGGRKPWKQKGTGRARVGSIRSPLWRGGGVTFGPTGNENFTKKINKKAKITALKQALTLNSENVSVIDSLDLKGKTKNASELFAKLGFNRGVLLVAEKTDATLRACSNLEYVSVVDAKELNVLDVLNAHVIVIEKDQLKALDERLGGKNE